MNSIKTILATVILSGLSVNAFAVGDEAGTESEYLSGAISTISASVPATVSAPVQDDSSNLGAADYFQNQRGGEDI